MFEFKFAKYDSKVVTLLNEAIKQIESRQYGVQQSNQELIRVALVFSEHERMFVAWQKI